MKVALYARVSTNGHTQDPEVQLRDLREDCQRRNWTVVHEYVDKGVSGSKEHRPAFDKLLAAAAKRRFEAVLVWKLDRFGRSLRHLVNTLAELESVGVAFISLKDNLDLSTPQGRLMFQIIGAMAEFERTLIQERVKAGLRNARAKGKVLGHPFPGKIDMDDVRRRRAKGEPLRSIASTIGCSAMTLCNRLK
jgi:DNA invertase Pin-like site-specific DNA recombinase